MRFGCCLPDKSLLPQLKEEATQLEVVLAGDREIIAAGYDFSECYLDQILVLSEEEIDFLVRCKAEGSFHLEVANCFIPGSLPICAGEKREELRAYVECVMARMQKLGIDTVVFGSGGARRVPEGMIYADAIAEIERFLIMCNEVAQKFGVTVVIEPLCHRVCNCLPTVAECGDLARKIDLPYVKLLADSFHAYVEEEDLNHIFQYKDILRHVHISEMPTQVIPGREGGGRPGREDGVYLTKFMEQVKKSGYDGRVTVECLYLDFAQEIRAGRAFLYTIL